MNSKIIEVDILSGAFMFIKSEAIEKCSMLDETFFMYGEDIDLSYRIKKAGYKNYYFSGSTIIHYKGESYEKKLRKLCFSFLQSNGYFRRKTLF